jgi:hypothetical protein
MRGEIVLDVVVDQLGVRREIFVMVVYSPWSPHLQTIIKLDWMGMSDEVFNKIFASMRSQTEETH